MAKPVFTVIVPCGQAKIWDKDPKAGPTPARDAYTSSYFKVNRGYAEAVGDRWLILSAKYGFISPAMVIPRAYNVSFKEGGQSDCVKDSALKCQAGMYFKADGTERVIVLGGKDYVEVVRRAFDELPGVSIETPFLGLSMLEQMREVKRATALNAYRKR